MKSKKDKAGQASAPQAVRIEAERANFKTLLLKNPNHFGTLPDLGFTPVKAMNQNKSYEELTCIGLHPEGNRLQGVINIKRHFGYDGATCMEGSVEYVRFFVRRATGWHDLGVSTVTSHDLPPGSPLPVSYSVEMEMNEARQYCTVENVVEVRGILSWNLEPPAGDPDWTPVWGNVLDARVQIAPRLLHLVSIQDLIEDNLFTIDPSILNLVDLQATIQPNPSPTPPPYAALKKKYEGKDVPAHRFGFTEAQKLLKRLPSGSLLSSLTGPKGRKKKLSVADLPALSSPFTALLPDLPGFLDQLINTKGNTTYEQLDCVGYNPETRILSGVITIKRNSGYSGDLCDPGSTEYVSFWGWYDGSWNSLGTAQVNVHDLAAISPGKPVRYAVFRAANLPERLCGEITGMRVRAILSWQTPPTGPDFNPVWGNVVETHVQPIITDVPVGDQRVRLMRINRVTVTKIDSAGFAQTSDIAGDCRNGNNSPFGGPIYIEGDLTVKSDSYFDPATGEILPGQHPPAYQVFVHKVGSPASPTQLKNDFKIAVFPVNPPPMTPAFTFTQEVQPFGGEEYYLYREGVIQAVNPRMLAVWEASGLEEGLYEIEIKGFVWSGGGYVPMATPSQIRRIYVYNGYPPAGNRPEVELHITDPAGDCGDVTEGAMMKGTYRVKDRFFGSLSMRLIPSAGGSPQPTPSVPILSSAAGATEASGTWTLNTMELDPCGYVIELHAQDRALVGNSCDGHDNRVAVGFCLRKP